MKGTLAEKYGREAWLSPFPPLQSDGGHAKILKRRAFLVSTKVARSKKWQMLASKNKNPAIRRS